MPLLVHRPKVSYNCGTLALVEQRERLRSDYKWINEKREVLSNEFLNKYVAVRNKQVILAEENVYTLMKKLRAKGLKPNKVAVEYLSEHPACFLL